MNKFKNILFGFLFCVCHSALAQHHLSIALGAGISKTDPDFDDNEFSKFQFKYAESVNIGLAYNYELNERFFCGANLQFSQINGRVEAAYYAKYYQDDEVFVLNTLNQETKYFFSYLVMPIYGGINVQDFNITLGWQTGWMIRSAIQSEKSALVDEMWVASSESSKNLDFFDRIDFGLNFGLGYSLNEKWKIKANYYHGINDILPSDLIDLGGINPWKNSQLTLGCTNLLF